MIISKLLKNRTAKNAGWIIAGKIVQMLIGLIVNLLSARYLGPDNYGLINYARAYVVFFTSLCSLGINSLLVKEFIENPQKDGTVIGTTLVLRAVSSFCSSLMIIGIVSIIDADEPLTILVVALCSLEPIFHIFETFNYWFQSRLESKVTAITMLIGYTVTSFYRLYLIITGKSIVYFALANSIDYICIALLLTFFYKKHKGGRLHFSWSYGKNLLSRSCHFIIPGLMVAIYNQTDKLMLKQMIGDAETGYYATAVSICNMWCFVLSAIIDSVYPSIMAAYKNNDIEAFNKKNKMLYAIVFYVSTFVSILFTVFSRPVIGIMFGEAYLPAVTPLKIITWYTAFSYLGVARNAWIVCKEKQKYLIWVYLSAAVSNVILNTLLIPIWGASGAALASLIAQIITTMVTPFFIKELRPNSLLMLEAVALKGLIKKK